MEDKTEDHDRFWEYLSRRPDAIKFLREYFNFIDYDGLSFNPKCLEVLKDREYKINKIDFTHLSRNRNFLPILEKYVNDKDNQFKDYLKSNLSYYYDISKITEKNTVKSINERSKNNIVLSVLNNIIWVELSNNQYAFNFLSENPNHVNWHILSSKAWAINLIEKHLDKVDFNSLSKNPSAIHILEANLSKINWFNLSLNENAIHLLEKKY